MDTAKQAMTDQLLKVVVEQIKLPLLHIARQAEMAEESDNSAGYSNILNIADMAIKLIDSYFLSLPSSHQTELIVEPVSLSSVLQTAAENLNGMAKLYNCDVELRLAGRFAPVMGNRGRLEAAFTMLGFSFIESQISDSSSKEKQRSKVCLAGYKSSNGLTGGVFSPQAEISNDDLKRARGTLGKTRQALPEISQTTGAGIFIADALFDNLASHLRVAHYLKMSGFATTLVPSQQLQLLS